MTNKPIVIFLCLADFAASAYNTCQAVNLVEQIESHHIVLSNPPYNFPAEIVCPLYPNARGNVNIQNYNRVCELLDRADLIHCWNNEREGYSLFAGLPIPYNKCKSYTFTGTSYRQGHTLTNQNIRNYRNDSRIIVQDPLFLRYLNEFPLEFIPHAVDTKKIVPSTEKISNTIGFYNQLKHPEYANYIQLLKQLLQKNHPEWQMVAGTTTSWWDRLQELSKCIFFFQNLSPVSGGPGRSSYEAMSMEIPVFSNVSPDIAKLTDRLEGLPAISATVQTFEKVLINTLKCTNYNELSKNIRKWVINTLGYNRVGMEYTKLFKELL